MTATDAEVANIGRRLAAALSEYAYTRKPEDKKTVAALQFELCRLCGEQLNGPRLLPIEEAGQ